MTESGRSAGRHGGRRPNWFRSRSKRMRSVLRRARGGQTAEAADRAGVARTTIMHVRAVASHGACCVAARRRGGGLNPALIDSVR